MVWELTISQIGILIGGTALECWSKCKNWYHWEMWQPKDELSWRQCLEWSLQTKCFGLLSALSPYLSDWAEWVFDGWGRIGMCSYINEKKKNGYRIQEIRSSNSRNNFDKVWDCLHHTNPFLWVLGGCNLQNQMRKLSQPSSLEFFFHSLRRADNLLVLISLLLV